MKKRLSIFHFLIAVMLFSLVLPGFANVGASTVAGSLTIHKFSQEPDGENGESGNGSENQNVPGDASPLDGVEFTITQTHSYDPTTDKWEPVSNGITRTGITQNGKVVFNFTELELGRYTVDETDGPPHVNLNPDSYAVDIPMTSKKGKNVNYHVHIYPKNEMIRGNVELTKIDGSTEIPLDGIQFELYDENDEKIGTTHTTNDFGKITVDNLAYGSYYFKEIATKDGYMLGSQHIEFFVEESGVTVEVNVANFKEPEVEKEVDYSAVNRGEIVEYTIKVQLPGDIGAYNSFVVTDVLHQNLQFQAVTASPDGFDFNEDGQTLTWTATDFTQLNPGEVEFKFTAKVSEDAEANVVINNKAYINYENGHGFDGEKETDDIPVTPTAGSLTVIKKDGDSNEELNGAKFELRQGDVVVASGTTKDGGKIFFGELDYGDYELVETKAPTGYNLLQNPINVTINEDNSNVTIEVDNYKSGWELPKTGGIGTSIFTLLGLTLMGAALFAFIRRRNGDSA